MPRPRSRANNGLPPNLYANNGGTTYIYRRPDDGSKHGMGSDRTKAIQAAKQLNSLLMPGSDLVLKVMGTGITLGAFIDTYENEILPPRRLAAATLSLYKTRFKQIKNGLGEHTPIDTLTIFKVATFLNTMTARPSNQTRKLLVDIFNHAAANGLITDNPAASTISKIEDKQRKRHTVAGLKKIRDHSPPWLQNAIDLALITAQRREDIVSMKFDDERDGALYVTQIKTEKHSDAGWIRFTITPELRKIIVRCRDSIASPYLIHRRPTRLAAEKRKKKEHWTQISPNYLSHGFQKARDVAKPYPDWTMAEQPGFHEIRALALHLYKRAGKGSTERKQIAGHTTEQMTANYEADHHDIVWTEVVPDLDISEITD